jgi:hypothetical protein
MISVKLKLEPPTFDGRVRKPGTAFLALRPNPISSKQWKSHSYWRRILPELHQQYDGICAYSCEFIPLVTGDDTVEHFLPKAQRPDRAYEWDNYRLVCLRMNGRKGTHQVLDPFVIRGGWFVLDFPSLQIRPDVASVPLALLTVADQTITTLDLNGEASIKSRERWVKDYCAQDISEPYLCRNAPFIYMELRRQGLLYTIGQIMQFP